MRKIKSLSWTGDHGAREGMLAGQVLTSAGAHEIPHHLTP